MRRLFTLTTVRNIALIVSGLVVASQSVLLPSALAISKDGVTSIFNNTPFYDPNFGDCINDSGTAVLFGVDNTQKAFNYFIAKGLQPFQAAGIVGNLMEESGVNPTAVQANGPGRGIAQWSIGARWDGTNADGTYKTDSLYGFAKSKNVLDLAVQLDFVWYEVTSGPFNKALDALRGTKNIDSATEVWMNEYERPNQDPNVNHLKDIRQPDARDALKRYGDSTTGATSGDDCGGSTDFTNGFIVYKQCDYYGNSTTDERAAARAWSGKAFGAGTVCGDGCGPSAIAMAVTNLIGTYNGQKITPDVVANYTADVGAGGQGGSNGWKLSDTVAPHFGLTGKYLGSSVDNITEIDKTLRAGGLVLMRGHMSSHYYQGDAKPHSVPYGPFSVGGHFVIIRAIIMGKDGKERWLIGNSGGWPDNLEYEPDWIYAHTTIHDTWSLMKK